MRPGSRTQPCRICRRNGVEAEFDGGRWCKVCRQEVIRSATLWGRGVGGGAALLLTLWVAASVATSSRFLVLWIVLIVGSYLFISKFVRRLAFDLILNHRSRVREEP